MSRNAGVYMLHCKICGKPYRRTNYMKRQGYKSNRVTFNGEQILLNDTHLMACFRKWKESQQP